MNSNSVVDSNLKAVFFDLDGTLLDTASDMSAALNQILEEDSHPTLPFSETRNIVSDGALALIKRGYTLKGDEDEVPSLRARFLRSYSENLSTHTRCFDGIEALLARLQEHNIAWGIVTNKPLEYAKPLIEAMHFPNPPCCLICPEHVSERKPAAEPMLLACNHAECETHEAIYIGDHIRDIESGRNANMATIAAAYGYVEPPELAEQWHADYVVSHADHIWPLIKERFNL